MEETRGRRQLREEMGEEREQEREQGRGWELEWECEQEHPANKNICTRGRDDRPFGK